jgi:tetratricopeptide (TPR) repeat protein
MMRLLCLPLFLALIAFTAQATAAAPATSGKAKEVCGAAPSTSVNAKDSCSAEEQAQRDKLQQAQRLTADGKPNDAIALIDQVLAYYQTKYPEGETRWYVTRSVAETLYYLTESTMPEYREPGKSEAEALMVAWAEAFFLKGYALNELGRPKDAKSALEQAVHLSPENATYLIELAEANKLERNWDECYRLYQDAETAALLFSPEKEKLADRLQAKRGQAFVFVEQGKLDQAEALLKDCLKLNPNDARAKEDLDYIAQLRKQSAGDRKN